MLYHFKVEGALKIKVEKNEKIYVNNFINNLSQVEIGSCAKH